jgi:hypothetical protein
MSRRPGKRTPEDVLGPSVVDEIRAIREEMDERAGHDPVRLVAEVERIAAEVRRAYGFMSASAPVGQKAATPQRRRARNAAQQRRR